MAFLRYLGFTALSLTLVTACSDNEPTPPTPPPVVVPVASLEVTPGDAALFPGHTTQLVATPKDATGQVLTGRPIVWSSSADHIARVDAGGRVTGVAEGTATITATSETKSASSTVTVQRAPAASVEITPSTANLALGDSVTLVATLRDDQNVILADRTVRWNSAKPEIARVDSMSGRVFGLADGTTTITATSESKSGSATLNVVVPVASVEVVAALDTLEAFETRELRATLRDARGRVLNGRTVRWASSDPAVATVDSLTGVLTGVDRGTVTVTATSEGKHGTASRVVVIRYRSVTLGTDHACDIASGGIAWCWGLNGREGRIGSENAVNESFSATPVRVPGGHRFTQLASFRSTTCGITTEGRAYCWGSNSWAVLGTGSSSPAQSYMPVPVSGGLTFRQLAAGREHFCGVTTDNRLFCWGSNSWAQLGNATRNSTMSLVHAAPSLSFASVTAGEDYTCGITTTGASYCWGFDGYGNLGDGKTISFSNTFTANPVQVVGGHGFRQISAGQQHTCAITASGQAYCWGRNSSRLGNGTGSETSTPSPVSGGLSFASISAGFFHSCGLTTNGEIWCWGLNGNGQLGVAMQGGSNVPVRGAGSLKAAEVVASRQSHFTCAISTDRLTTYCWGLNHHGQLGNGSRTDSGVANITPSIVVGQRPL
jgi:alpha-tubulin suppressor-like RCC1 family protein